MILTPGVYPLDRAINVSRADMVVLGLGFPTLVPTQGNAAMAVADVSGVKLAGLMFDAGPTNSPVLLQIGGASPTHPGSTANPISLHHVFFRIGGATPGSATVSLIVNSDNVLLDDIRAWRADHGAGVGWTTNPAASGLIVNGDNVTAYGLAVEHYQNYQVLWNGQAGRTIFFQNEMPYDAPSQTAWRTGGYAAYKIADSVTSHEAWGMGSYCFFRVNPGIHAAHGFEVPVTAGVKLHDLLTVSLGGVGIIDHVVNSTGAAAQGPATTAVNVTNFPNFP